jgi:hypothetical protein
LAMQTHCNDSATVLSCRTARVVTVCERRWPSVFDGVKSDNGFANGLNVGKVGGLMVFKYNC